MNLMILQIVLSIVINEALREVLAGYMTSQISRTHTLVEVLNRITLTE